MSDAPAWSRLGVIAGDGVAPFRVIEACQMRGAEAFVLRLDGWADPALARFDHATVKLGEFGRAVRLLKERGCDAVTFVGGLSRPDLSKLSFDARGLTLAPKLMAAARKGDDALLQAVLGFFGAQGFQVLGAHEIAAGMTLGGGVLGAHAPSASNREDALKASQVARALGAWDVGQGAVVCDGLVLAVEAQEGTDAMLARLLDLPIGVRGEPSARRGVLVKTLKPGQDTRIDLPTLGVRTVEGAAAAGLAGVAAPADRALVVDADAVRRAADDAGVFVWGFTPNEDMTVDVSVDGAADVTSP